MPTPRFIDVFVRVCVLVYGRTPGVMSDIRVYVVDEKSVLCGALWSSKIHQISPSLEEKSEERERSSVL